MQDRNYFANWQTRQLIQRSSSYETLTYEGIAMNLPLLDKKTMTMIIKKLYPKTERRIQALGKNKEYRKSPNYKHYKDLIGIDIENLSLNKMKELYIRLRRFNLNKGATPQGQKEVERIHIRTANETLQRLTGITLSKDELTDLFDQIKSLREEDVRITPQYQGEYGSDLLIQDVYEIFVNKKVKDYGDIKEVINQIIIGVQKQQPKDIDQIIREIEERKQKKIREGEVDDDEEDRQDNLASAISMLLQ